MTRAPHHKINFSAGHLPKVASDNLFRRTKAIPWHASVEDEQARLQSEVDKLRNMIAIVIVMAVLDVAFWYFCL